MSERYTESEIPITQTIKLTVRNEVQGLKVRELEQPVLPVESEDESVEAGKNGWYASEGGGMIGAGLLSIENAEKMKDFFVSKAWPAAKRFTAELLSQPQVQGSLYVIDGVGELKEKPN